MHIYEIEHWNYSTRSVGRDTVEAYSAQDAFFMWTKNEEAQQMPSKHFRSIKCLRDQDETRTP